MTYTTTPSPATRRPMRRRRFLATALIVAVGTAVGVGATGLTSDGGRRDDAPVGDTKDHPNYGPIDTVDAWTGDAKDHPNYGPIDTVDAWTGDTKDHPNYGPVDTAATWTGDTKDHPNYGPAAPASHFHSVDEEPPRRSR